MATRTRRPRRVVVVDNRALAERVGARIRDARLRAGQTQAEVAGSRYTPAYISALERGHAKPSMAALAYIAERLATTVRDLVEDKGARWSRLEADLRLAAGDWEGALTAYGDLLETVTDSLDRALVRRGVAETLCRLNRGPEAISHASAAAEELARLGDGSDAALARYWLAYAHFQADALHDARSILDELRAAVRTGLAVQDDFRLRVLVASASVELRDGNLDLAHAYLDEASALVDGLDARRRATFLFSLAVQYQETGDLEGALRSGSKALTLFEVTDADAEVASLKNTMALALIDSGNLDRAETLIGEASAAVERLGDDRLRPHLLETQARLALARGDTRGAVALAEQAVKEAVRSGNPHARASALVTMARSAIRDGASARAMEWYEEAAMLLDEHRLAKRRSDVLAEWAELLAAEGRHQEANRLYGEAFTARRS